MLAGLAAGAGGAGPLAGAPLPLPAPALPPWPVPPALDEPALSPPPAPPAAGAGGLVFDQWMDSSLTPAVVHSPYIGAGAVMQVLTRNPHGVVDGTAYLVVQGVHGAGAPAGRLVEVKHGGCSEPTHRAL